MESTQPNISEKMIHLTLNTGHSFHVPSDKVSLLAIRALTPMVVKKGDIIPHFAPWRTVISVANGYASFDIRRNKDESVCLNVVAWNPTTATEAWSSLEKIYLSTAETLATAGISLDLEMPEMPTATPWLATWILPTAAIIANGQDLYWMADFEQCLAATIIHKYNPSA